MSIRFLYFRSFIGPIACWSPATRPSRACHSLSSWPRSFSRIFLLSLSPCSLLIRFAAAYKSKGALKQDDLRRRREEQQVEIRRQKREENISKRRNFIPSSGADSDDEVAVGAWDTDVRVFSRKLSLSRRRRRRRRY